MDRRLGPALALSGVLALAACSGGSSESESGSGATLDTAAFADLVDSPGVVVLDVRTADEFAAGHIPGAVNIDVSGPGFASEVGTLDADASYAVYCRSGNRSATAMRVMLDAGIESVAHLGGGIVAWAEAGGELTTP
jgi:rhodanese-related sulfurtransferase